MDGELRYWLALKRAPNIGNIYIRRLVEHFGSARQVFSAGNQALGESNVLGPSNQEALTRFTESFSDWDVIDRELERADRLGVSLLTLSDDAYPDLLKNIADPPILLYVKGSLRKDDSRAVAVVGSRYPTGYGFRQAERLAGSLASNGITIVSGMARGIDSASHKAALKAGGRTIAVLGSGIDVIYPPENKGVFKEITASGAVISEFEFGTSPERKNFPRRNRVISGISLGTIVVEASMGSGSLITARSALDQGREVFAVPGSVSSPASKGAHSLLKQGARLVESAADVLGELSGVLGGLLKEEQEVAPPLPGRIIGLAPDEELMLSNVDYEPKQVDEIAASCGLGASRTLGLLLRLEIKGLIEQQEGMMFRRC